MVECLHHVCLQCFSPSDGDTLFLQLHLQWHQQGSNLGAQHSRHALKNAAACKQDTTQQGITRRDKPPYPLDYSALLWWEHAQRPWLLLYLSDTIHSVTGRVSMAAHPMHTHLHLMWKPTLYGLPCLPDH